MRFNLQKFNRLFIFNFNLLVLVGFIFCCDVHAQVVHSINSGELTNPGASKTGTIKILHIGDSHLQPNNLTGSTRYILQKEIGNAGRGLIFPYSLAKTYGPNDYTFSSDVTWTSARITKASTQSVGLTGISVKSTTTSGKVSWSTGKDLLDYPFQKGQILFEMQGCTACSVEVNGVKRVYTNQTKVLDTLSFLVQKDTSTLKFQGGYFTLLDLVEETNLPGVIYNSTGVESATFTSYNLNPNFQKSVALIRPDFLLISLGTNESYRNWNASYFNKEVNLCLDRIAEASPTTEVILVLPNENYKKINGKYVYNVALDSVRNSLKNIAEQRQLTTYDQLEAMGGKGSMLEWLKQGLVNTDHVHLLRKGYQKQGELLAAFLLGYLQNKPD
jgi:hypothetical protein